MWAHQVSTESYQIARVHIEEISLLTTAAFQKVGSTVILFQVKVGFSQCKGIQVLCIFLYLGQTDRPSKTSVIRINFIKLTSLQKKKESHWLS